jgi:molecular chaperone DnaK (HSP70)
VSKAPHSRMTDQPASIIGIDLGTTNSALAYAATPEDSVQILDVPQLINPGEVSALPLLPSSLYIPGAAEFVEGTVELPWPAKSTYIVGTLAQKRGVENPSRFVSSAKSWLSNQNADATLPLLPLTALEGVEKISPLEASRQYLEHLRNTWNRQFPDAPFDSQTVLITVPASFDAAARDLTQKAAHLAGYPEVTLLEEPQAAFYAWLERHPDWRELVKPGDLILVVDIGGGTTDFTLISVAEESGELKLERVAVGDHILLGGDNMDLALARFAEQQLAAKGNKLDTIQFQALWQQCRSAKETLLADNEGQEATVTVLGRGSGLVKGSLRAKLGRNEVRSLLLDGFFPLVDATAKPQGARRSALAEVGLQYASDAAVTRHLAHFLANAGASGSSARPTHLLFNGGVLQAAAIEDRLTQVLNSWLAAAGAKPVVPLQDSTKHDDLMHAVAQGAAYYGVARTGKGVRIRGGVPRTYYVGIESAMPAVPGLAAPLKALTVVPFGLEEGSQVESPGRRLALYTGEHAVFRFFSSTTRKNDEPGLMLDEITEELEELAPIDVYLPLNASPDAKAKPNDVSGAGQPVAVTLESRVTETGMLELWCVAADARRWKLEFNVRERH